MSHRSKPTLTAPGTSPLKAARAKCLDCSGGSGQEVKFCPVENCPLWPFRFGQRPKTAQGKGLAVKSSREGYGPLCNENAGA